MKFQRTFGAAILFSLPIFSLGQTVAELGAQLTVAALKIQGAISPTCLNLQDCQTFSNEVVPRCQRLQGDAGCWCGNHNPLHNCAICMSVPSDTTTSPDQMAAAIGGHTDYHQACNAFEKLLNGTSTTASGTSTATSAAATASGDSGSKAPIGAIVGGAVGGVVALIIAILVFVLWRRNRNKETVGPSSVSLFSGDRTSTLVNQQPRPYSDYSHPQGTFGHHDSSFGAPNYAAATMPYQGNGMTSPSPGLPSGGLKSDGSYNKHPEPMSTPY
ncbi:hypothetical protein RSOLAG1IB_06882 [Rhizoctonia solani AG-1 IB]|uniref:SKG6 domain-containing protein n=1 Tax=Thanatephorus cucumeris (strain AG1-IB / isolate 7/3/14) TaxID=1108050 RepID=A0A0B7F7Z8_THACB|nr:hypothetical protein RSOLAG1IB_06882 [Rhizoctonia solani AG-1 IB]